MRRLNWIVFIGLLLPGHVSTQLQSKLSTFSGSGYVQLIRRFIDLSPSLSVELLGITGKCLSCRWLNGNVVDTRYDDYDSEMNKFPTIIIITEFVEQFD